MELAAILAAVAPYEANGPVQGEASGLSYDSKTIESGELFFCLRGKFTDGHAFAAEAVARGAAGLVVEEFLDLPALQIKVPDTRRALSRAGRQCFGDPASRLGLVGVTGTNGKTTTTFYIRSVLQQLQGPVGLIGTVYNQMGGAPAPSSLTTPESLDLWRLLAEAVADRCPWVVMEVSSHALAMHRVEPADVDLAVILNITRDHFEFHGTFEHYLQSKARLVRELPADRKGGRPRAAVLNADEPLVAELGVGLDVPVVTFGLERPADVSASEIKAGPRGSEFLLHLPGAMPALVRLPMPGRYNVSNALAAAAVGWLAGVSLAGIVAGLEGCAYVPGRAEVIDAGQPFTVIVDFAHNPDALAKVVTLRPEQPGGRSILVFGAEGGKDRGKRPEMGRAARGADFVVVTSDNMPKEEPAEVAREVSEGLEGHPHAVVLDRRQAIERALTMARPGDLVIIAGKGHEQTWVYGGQRIAFDDRAVVRATIRTLMEAEL
ncbi:MAG TPA: UDP-N-acetylmuramoyl-L-alanyl-D-glutamate--2,6-diaminopimelate ligase [Symbiobacteriaceae bacterium]|nr:UDP-N-acetylmuramoyl-L-alanyl-D-glutamate--2,6-diaminopimelate ligase [Symbiobacteriaceae bacterium]